ncbi:MAG: tripartite tricarboxylate transporter substrate binding protein [Betaproteobacteria bacterium]|nr:tripartite tricarboxylate transporter substrate binding protein [Betaproteobacteria bacterium]
MSKHLQHCAVAMLIALCPLATAAQQYPTKPVRFIIPFPPGGPTDMMGRLAGDILSRAYGQQFIADNRGGAGGNIGSDICAKAPADGYTICMLTAAQGISPGIYRKLPFDPVKDFAHVTLMAILPSMLTTHPALPVKNVKDIIALAKSKPGQLAYASTGNGSSPHMMMELFKYLAKIDMLHIPYKGQAPAVVDQISGQVQLAFNTAIGVMPHVQANRLKPIAISTKGRFPPMPELPTVAESGLSNFDGSSWQGVVFPAGTPQDIVTKVHATLAAELTSAKGKDALLKRGGIASGNTPAEFAAFVKGEVAKWSKIAKAAKIHVD